MKEALLDRLVCPLCHAPLMLTVQEQNGDIVEEGTLTCKRCFERYSVHCGIPDMISPRIPGIDLKLREAQGWADLSQKRGWYIPEEKIDLALPYVVEKLGWDPAIASSWVGTRFSLDEMMARYVRPGMRVLEVGAGKTWTGHYFLERGCEYTGCDIVNDPNIGVGRSRFFTSRFGYYEAVAADAEHLPFAGHCFDLVFGIAALHHSVDLPRMLREMARVTRPGGLVAGLNEGVRAFRSSPDYDMQNEEKSFGINEHVYSLGEYFSAFWRSGVIVTRMLRSAGYEIAIGDDRKAQLKRLLGLPVIGGWAAALILLGHRHPYDGVTLYGRKLAPPFLTPWH